MTGSGPDAARQVHRRRAAEEGRGEQIVILAEGERAAVGRDLEAGDQVALGMDAAVAAVEVDADQLPLLVLGDLEEQAVAGGAEMGVPPLPTTRVGGAARGRDAVDAGVARPELGGEEAAAGRARTRWSGRRARSAAGGNGRACR